MPESQMVTALKKWKSKDTNLHDHLCEVLDNIHTQQINGVDHFQRISEYFKGIQFKCEEISSEAEIQRKRALLREYPKWLIQQEKAIKQSATKQSKNGNKIIQNFQRHSEVLFEPVGIWFGKQETFRINTALKILAEKQSAVSLRFWGKVLASAGDYYVIQGVCKKKKEPLITGDMQKYREGVNYYSYWVSSRPISDDWYELPLITPEQVKISRLIKYLFTGKLNAQIKDYPKFPGQERHLLKCQLVRITHNCEIAPSGFYVKQEEGDDVDFAEQFKMPEFNDLVNLQNWQHLNPYILGIGRADYYKDLSLPEEQREEQIAKLQEIDPKIDRLRGINEDKPVEKLGMEGCWIARTVGNLQAFSNVGKEEGTTSCYGSVVLKNPHWPGWLTVANAKTFSSIYIGYGYKLTQDAFYPPSPQDLNLEGEDIVEFNEPNPKDPPDELEPDSDDEGKKPEE